MKLASLKASSRDGELVVVDAGLERCLRVPDIAPNLQYALDHWPACAPHLAACAERLDKGGSGEPLDINALHAPLPRAYQWLDASAYVNHVELLRKARGASLPERFWTDPLMYQGASDSLLGPRDPIVMANVEWGIDFEAEVAIITDAVPMGISADAAAAHIKLFMLVNDVSLRHLVPAELEKGFGFVQAKPASAFSPTAISADELGAAWDGRKLHLPLCSRLNGRLIGQPQAGEDMVFDFPVLIAHAAKTRPLAAGTIIGSGTVSNRDRSRGSSCLAEVRMLELIEHGAITTAFMAYGDEVEIEMRDDAGRNLFGSIRQRLQAAS